MVSRGRAPVNLVECRAVVDATIWLDAICPFCYLAEAPLARLEAEGALRVRVRPFEIHPETPRGGVAIREVAGPRADALFREIAWTAEEAGVEFTRPERLPSSRLALEGIEMARAAKGEAGAAAFARGAFRAYFREGLDIGDEAVLRGIAVGVGVSRDLQDRFFIARGFSGAVDAARRDAEDRLVSAVPAIFVGEYPLLGYQPYERLKQVIERMRR